MSKLKPLHLTKPIRINVYDIDALGIVSNIVYIRWLEDLRMLFLDTYYPFQTLYKEGKSPILSDTKIKYLYPLKIEDNPSGEIWMSEITKSRWECSFAIKVGDKLCASATQNGYFIDIKRQRPTRIPEKLQALWEQEAK